MNLKLIRNATFQLEYAGHHLIVDPYLALKHSRPSFAGKSPNPLVDLPCSPEEAIRGCEAVIVSHLHSDHFDPAAQELLPKDLPILCQPGDEGRIASMGFRQVTPIENYLAWQGIAITRTSCQHGSGEVLLEMGPASGFIFQAENEPVVYWAGDTIWTDSVAEIVAGVQPQVIITHSSGAVWGGEQVLIVMDAAQTITVCKAAPQSLVVAIHMEALDHGTVSRRELRRYGEECGITPDQLLIPADGETLAF